MKAALRADRLFVRHAGASQDAVRDLTLAVQPGEILALVGPNGAGKSSLMSALAHSLAERSGAVWLGDIPIAALPPRARARRLARVPQEPSCSEGVRVAELVSRGRHHARAGLRGAPREERRAVTEALDALDLLALREREIETLSGGERRRAWLALALAQRAPVLLLDEPTSGLDLRHQWDLLATLRDLNRRGLTLVVSLHDLEQAASLADRIAVLHRGRLYCVAAPEEALHPETLRDVFRVDAQLERATGRFRLNVLGPAEPLRSL